MLGKIVLAGGGGAKESRLVDELFASWLRPDQKLLYLPLALTGTVPLRDCENWLRTTFEPLHVTHIEMWSSFTGHQAKELAQFSAIYIGGGNTYALLAQCIESGFDRHLIQYVTNGGIIYGGSAGGCDYGHQHQYNPSY